MTKEKEIEETNQDKYRKLHLGFHHSPNRFCSTCIKIGQNSQKQKVLEMIEECKCYCEFCAWGEEHEEKDKLIKVTELTQKIKGEK